MFWSLLQLPEDTFLVTDWMGIAMRRVMWGNTTEMLTHSDTSGCFYLLRSWEKYWEKVEENDSL